MGRDDDGDAAIGRRQARRYEPLQGMQKYQEAEGPSGEKKAEAEVFQDEVDTGRPRKLETSEAIKSQYGEREPECKSGEDVKLAKRFDSVA